MARARKTAEPAPESDGVTEVTTEETPKKKGRTASPLLAATREFEAAHRAADKARARIARVQPLIDALADLEEVEQAAYEKLQDVIKNA